MGEAGHPAGWLRNALRTRSYNRAVEFARELPRVDLRAALELTMLAAEKDPQRYERMARRWLARFLEEKRPTLELVHWIAEDLQKIGDPQLPEVFKADAGARLREVAGKL